MPCAVTERSMKRYRCNTINSDMWKSLDGWMSLRVTAVSTSVKKNDTTSETHPAQRLLHIRERRATCFPVCRRSVCVCVVTQAFHLGRGSGPPLRPDAHPANYRREPSYGLGSPPTAPQLHITPQLLQDQQR